MTSLLKSRALGFAGMIIALAIPCSATSLSFSTSDTSGASIQTSGTGANAIVTTLTGIRFTSVLEIPGGTYSLLAAGPVTDVFLNYNSSTKVLTLSTGGAALTGIFSNIGANTTLATINLTSALTANVGSGAGASFSLNTPTVSSVTGNSTFLADLGLSVFTGFSSLGISGVESGTSLSFSDSSNGLGLTAATPEPISFLLMGGGLTAIGVFRRKKFSPKNS